MTNLEWLKTLSAEELADWFYSEWLEHMQYTWSSSQGGLVYWLKQVRTEPPCETCRYEIGEDDYDLYDMCEPMVEGECRYESKMERSEQ